MISIRKSYWTKELKKWCLVKLLDEKTTRAKAGAAGSRVVRNLGQDVYEAE